MLITPLLLLLIATPTFDFDAETTSYRATLASLVSVDTTNPPGNEIRAVAIIAARLKKEGIPAEVTEFGPNRKNLVARLKGSGQERPIILLAHTDVVGTEGQPWSTPPHTVTEKDGFLYGRGVIDDLGMVAANLETIVLLKRSGVKLRRDIIVAFTGDEESGGAGIRALLEHDPSLYQAGLVINEGAIMYNTALGAPLAYATYEVAQKTYQDFTLTTTGTTGHSSVPKKDNAIYRLSRALARLDAAGAPPRLIDVTRAYFKARARLEEPANAKALNALADATGPLPRDALAVVEKNPSWAAQLRTTCVPTMLSAGTKNNALPASATANVNCRILPDESIDQTETRMRSIIADPEISIARRPAFGEGPPAAVGGELADALTRALAEMAPGAPLIPTMTSGANDSRFFRQHGTTAYGLRPFASLEGDRERSHGANERLEVSAIRPGLELYTKVIVELAAER